MIGPEISVKWVIQKGPTVMNSIATGDDDVVGGPVELHQLKALLMKGEKRRIVGDQNH